MEIDQGQTLLGSRFDRPDELSPDRQGDITVWRDVTYARVLGYRPLLLDLAVPIAAGPVPVVVYVHSGGWLVGSHKPADSHGPAELIRPSLLDAGLAVAAVQYRFSGEAPFPACLHDVCAAVRWLRRFGADLGLDPERIGTWGESAGGHLAALLALNIADPDLLGQHGITDVDATVQAGVAWYPPTDLLSLQSQSLPGATADHDAADSPDSRLIGGPLQSLPELAARASATRWASHEAAPLLFVHGDSDLTIPPLQSQVLHDVLALTGAPVRLSLVPGADHVLRGVDPAPWVATSTSFLMEHLARPQAPKAVSSGRGGPPEQAPRRVPQAVLDDLRRRLRTTRLVPLPEGAGWQRGTDPAYLAELVDYWAGSYDWREHEHRVRTLPWTVAESSEGSLRLLHQPSDRPDAPSVVLLHGWPDSVLRFARVLPLLTDFHVVIPALPGFPFGYPLDRPGMSVAVMAELVADAMRELGYERYVVSGGDIGGDVAEQLAAAHPDRVAALHLPNVSPRRLPLLDRASLTAAEQDYVQRAQQFQMTEGGYLLQQRTKPHSLAPGLGDSPAGLAAWLVEKYRSWSDCHDDLESVFPRDDLLTWITAYWVTDTIGTSFSAYTNPAPPPPSIDVPTYFSLSPRDIVPAPRAVAEHFYNVAGWHEHATGGHFAAWEYPVTFVHALRQATVHP